MDMQIDIGETLRRRVAAFCEQRAKGNSQAAGERHRSVDARVPDLAAFELADLRASDPGHVSERALRQVARLPVPAQPNSERGFLALGWAVAPEFLAVVHQEGVAEKPSPRKLYGFV